jgi:XTP/dITP diphosphohydrolase
MLHFATTNEGKVREARERLGEEVVQFDYDYEEIQSPDLATIAARGAREAYEAAPGDAPVIVDDAGLFVDALDGFPGPYSAYVEDTLGVGRVQSLVAATEDRAASFRAVVAYADGTTVETFPGRVTGRIVAPRGDGGFGYDPIFEHEGRTFAELSPAEKNAVSHRGRALDAAAAWMRER